MLVLTRKLQEQIRIGQDIVITVLEFRGSAIRLGIEAPRDVRVMREELPRREITINLESNEITETPASSNVKPLAKRPASIEVQSFELNREQPIRSTINRITGPQTAARGPLSSKLTSRRAGNTPNSTVVDPTIDPRPEADLFGQDHLLAAQKENHRLFSSAV